MQPSNYIAMELHLTSPLPPSVNHYMAYRVINRSGKPTAMSYKTNEALKYRLEFADYVRAEVPKQSWDMEPNNTQHFYVDATFYFSKTNMDCNNYWKVMLDAITDTRLIWLDDNVVCERVRRIYYDTEHPRIELVISPVEYIGIFDNAQQLEQFVSNCAGCIRQNRNCSILNKAKEGRIQSEICNLTCSKYKQRKTEIKEK